MDSAFEAGKKLMGGDYTQFTLAGKALLSRRGRVGREPHIGDQVYFYSQSLGRVAHVGIVVSVEKSGDRYSIETVEGNTSSVSFDRNGGCVSRKKYIFTLREVGGTNRINCFCSPLFGGNTCTAEELVKVACEEIGYEEKASNAGLDGKHTNVGRNNYTKYGEWYKENCDGNHPAYWCEQLTSWCAYKACKMHQKNSFTGWVQFDGKWIYEFNGVVLKGQWIKSDDRWYVTDEAGYMITGWFKQDNDEWYYLNPQDGAMLSGQWINVDGADYYLTSSGVMAKSGYIKDSDKELYYWVDNKGKYQKEYDTATPKFDKYELIE